MSAPDCLIPREAAVRAVRDAYADRTSYVVVATRDGGGDRIRPTASRLAGFGGARLLLDLGEDAVGSFGAATFRGVAGVLAGDRPVVAVFLVPKSVPAAHMGRRLGQPLGDSDVILVQDEHRIHWPHLLLEAIAPYDPAFVNAVAANALENLS